MRIVSSKDRSKVEEFARRTQRKILWRDEEGVWRAAISRAHVPVWEVEWMWTPGVEHFLTDFDRGVKPGRIER